MATTDILRVDPIGLAKQLADRPKVFAIYEAVQNSLDAPGTTYVDVTFKRSRARSPMARLHVEDDAPDGWTDLDHAYTLFAPSEKADNPALRGRMNVGEKLIIALAVESNGFVKIHTTKGGIYLSRKGRRRINTKRERGSVLTAEFRATNDEAREALEDARLILVPKHIELFINGEKMESRSPLAIIEGKPLVTVKADDEGFLRRTTRQTDIHVHEPIDGRPFIYEMGIPVVPIDCEWSVDIQQRVPLNSDRDNVTPAYLKKVMTLVTNAMAEKIEDASAPWVTLAMADDDVEPDAVEEILDKRFGKKRVMYDPSDPDANTMATLNGYTVVPGRSLGKGVGDTIRRFRKAGLDLCPPAGQVTPSREERTTIDEGGVGMERVCVTCKRPL